MTFRFYRRAGLRPITPRMLAVLQELADAKAQEWPFVHLPHHHWRTLRVMADNGWIFASDGLDGRRYTITASGERALHIYSVPARKYDGLCPTCRTRPRIVRGSGRRGPYCQTCETDRRRRERRLGVHYGIRGLPCKTEGCDGIRHVSKGGRVYVRCKACLAAHKREWQRARRKADER